MIIGKSEGTPLIQHLADVAAVAEALLDLPTWRRRFERAWGTTITPCLSGRLATVAALHDIGKATPGFQDKLLGRPGGHGHIHPLRGLLTERNGTRLLKCLPFLDDWSKEGEYALLQLLFASFSHHGTPLESEPNFQQEHLWPDKDNAPTWAALAELGRILPRWFPAAFSSTQAILAPAPAQHVFAGLVMLADWIGSDLRFFPGSRNVISGTEMDDARKRARNAIKAIGLDVGPSRPALDTLPDFGEQFGFPPNALQLAVEDLPLRPGGEMVIVEAETGLGKTEAALRYFTRLYHAGIVDALYFANPLRFAATQLFRRIRTFAQRTFNPSAPPTVLAVPGYLQVDEATAIRLPKFEVLWDDEPNRAQAEQRWACEHPKRFLSAPLSAGTIDQALLASLKTRHAQMRAIALSRSLLVVDEVHASDAYMTQISLSLVDLFRRLGGQILLLSATLGGYTRRLYLQGMGGSMPIATLNSCLNTHYPCLSTTSDIVPIIDNRPKNSRKPPILVSMHGIQDNPDQIARLAANLAADGGRILVLRNSVRTALETQLALEDILPPHLLFSFYGSPCPHHSRFTAEDRAVLDAEVERRFGVHGTTNNGVIVSTQTLEQSLDVDFDVLITDLCPMDVLLQRLGRLFRHRARDKGRPVAHSQPKVLVLTPPEQSPGALKRAKGHQYGLDRAYENLVILMATWDILKNLDKTNTPLITPRMSRDLVESAIHPEAIEAVATKYHMQQDLIEAMGRLGAQAGAGSQMRIDWGKPFAESIPPGNEKIPTRLGLNDQHLRFPKPFPTPFGNESQYILLPGFLSQNIPAEAEPSVLNSSARKLDFELGGQHFHYDRLGLRKE